MNKKWCQMGRHWVDADDFYKTPTNGSWCRECRKIYQRIYYRAHKAWINTRRRSNRRAEALTHADAWEAAIEENGAQRKRIEALEKSDTAELKRLLGMAQANPDLVDVDLWNEQVDAALAQEKPG